MVFMGLVLFTKGDAIGALALYWLDFDGTNLRPESRQRAHDNGKFISRRQVRYTTTALQSYDSLCCFFILSPRVNTPPLTPLWGRLSTSSMYLEIIASLFLDTGLSLMRLYGLAVNQNFDAARMELWGRLHNLYIECELCLCRAFTLARMASLAQQLRRE